MNKFSKILTMSILLAASLYADDNTIIEFEKKRISQNPNVQIKDARINTKKELPLAGWYGYILDVEANVQGKTINAKDILFSDGKYISLELYDASNGKSLKDLVTPNLSDKYHDDAKLIAGNKNGLTDCQAQLDQGCHRRQNRRPRADPARSSKLSPTG